MYFRAAGAIARAAPGGGRAIGHTWEELMRVDTILRQKANRIIAIGMSASVERAARLLQAENIGAIVVKDTCSTEGEVVLGLLTERDIVRALADHGAAVLRMPVSQLMSRAFVSCDPEDEADGVIGVMNKHRIRHMPVLQGDALIGIVSMLDMIGRPPELPEAGQARA